MAPTTDLEALIQHLAGRGSPASAGVGDSPDSLASRLDDPASDASRFLDEIRQKTRALLNEPPGDRVATAAGATAAGQGPAGLHGRAGWRGSNLVFWLALCCGPFVGGVLGAAATRLLDRTEARRADGRNDRLLALIRTEFAAGKGPVADFNAITTTLAQVGDRLDRLDGALAALRPPLDQSRSAGREPPEPGRPASAGGLAGAGPSIDATLGALATDLAAVRREIGLSEAATGRQIQEMRTVLQEVNTVVRRVLSRPQTDNVANVTAPLIALAVQALINNLQHPSAQVRGEAVEQLMRFGAPARSALPALQLRLNQETDSNVRTTIQAALNVLSSG